jgi:hypothetical protein
MRFLFVAWRFFAYPACCISLYPSPKLCGAHLTKHDLIVVAVNDGLQIMCGPSISISLNNRMDTYTHTFAPRKACHAAIVKNGIPNKSTIAIKRKLSDIPLRANSKRNEIMLMLTTITASWRAPG